MQITQYTYCTILFLVDIFIFWVSALSLRKKKRTTRSFTFERAKTWFFLSQILLCISFVSLSYLLTSPYCFQSDVGASKDDSSNLILRLLVRDTKALLNAVRAFITFGLTVQLYLHPQLFLTDVSTTMAFYLLITSLVTLGLQSLQFYSFGYKLPFFVSLFQAGVVLFSYKMGVKYSYEQEGVTEGKKKEDNIINHGSITEDESEVYKFKFLGNTEYGQQLNNPLSLQLKKLTMDWVSAEMKLFILYNLVVFGLRAKSALESEVDFTEFVEGYVQATETAVYKGLVVAFGYYGAKYMISAPLAYYSFGNLVLSGISTIAVIPAFFSSYQDSYYLLSVTTIILEIVCKIGGVVHAVRLRRLLRDNMRAVGDVGQFDGSDDPAKKTAHVGTRDMLRRAGLAVIATLVLWIWEAVTIACLPLLSLSLSPSLSLPLPFSSVVEMTALAFNFGVYGTFDVQQQVLPRRMWLLLLAAVFSLLSLNELFMVIISGAGPLFSTATFIFFMRAVGCAWLAYSLYTLKRGEGSVSHKNYDTVSKYSSRPIPAEVQRYHFISSTMLKALFCVFLLFAILLVSSSADYSGLIGNFSFAAFATVFHFCFLLVGVGYQGISLYNTQRLGTLISCCSGIAAIAVVNFTLLMWQSSTSKGAGLHDTLVFYTLVCIAGICGATSLSSMWLRSALVIHGVSERPVNSVQ